MNDRLKTIFIPIYHAWESRNVLRTDVFLAFKKQLDLRIILLVPQEKITYYQENFSEQNKVIIEGTPPLLESYFIHILRKIGRLMLNNGSLYWFSKVQLTVHRRLSRYLFERFFSKLGVFKFFRDIVRWKFQKLTQKDNYSVYFEKYQPDLVFLPDIYEAEDVYLGLASKKRGVKTVGMVRSWDNVTSKGVCFFLPDKLIVHNEVIKEEAIKIIGFNGQDIAVVGLPHFDYYVNYQPTAKEKFFGDLGLAANARYLLFVPYFGTYTAGVNEILEILDESIVKKELPPDLKIVLRMPPSYQPDYVKLFSSPRVIVDYPGFKYRQNDKKGDWEFSDEDMFHLADSIYYSQLVLNFASTLTVDAAAFDKPVINLAFDGKSEKFFAYSIKGVYVVEHFKKVLATGGAPLVKSKKEMIEKINAYLNKPSLDQAGRQAIVKQQCFKLDGQAGERTAGFILKNLYE